MSTPPTTESIVGSGGAHSGRATGYSLAMTRWLCGVVAAVASTAAAATVPKWGRFEVTLTSSTDVTNPSATEVRAEFRSPSGVVQSVYGFWDGGRLWRVRFAPGEEGQWTWTTRGPNGRLTRKGGFTCNAAKGHGGIVVSGDRRHFTYSDGTPFFWLADTAWNGPLLATDADWKTYLDKRKQQGFTAIQWVAAQWRGSPTGDSQSELAYTGSNPIRINAAFFRRLEQRHEAITRAGLVSVPVMLWAIQTRTGSEVNPGLSLSESDAILLARYMLGRWGADPVAWLLNGDGDYRGARAERWKNIGRGVFDGVWHAPVSLHSGGMMWVVEEFRNEGWLDVAGYQSAHADSVKNSLWIHSGPPSLEWKRSPARPVISLEAPYDQAPSEKNRTPDFLVRRNQFWAIFNAPVAGITYGVHGVWGWSDGVNPAPGHGTTVWPHWKKLIDLPGAIQTIRMRRAIESVDWTSLVPAPEVLAEQPGTTAPAAFISAMRTARKEMLVYTPQERMVRLRHRSLPGMFEAEWVNIASGEKAKAVANAAGEVVHFETPAPGDWLLIVRGKR